MVMSHSSFFWKYVWRRFNRKMPQLSTLMGRRLSGTLTGGLTGLVTRRRPGGGGTGCSITMGGVAEPSSACAATATGVWGRNTCGGGVAPSTCGTGAVTTATLESSSCGGGGGGSTATGTATSAPSSACWIWMVAPAPPCLCTAWYSSAGMA